MVISKPGGNGIGSPIFHPMGIGGNSVGSWTGIPGCHPAGTAGTGGGSKWAGPEASTAICPVPSAGTSGDRAGAVDFGRPKSSSWAW